VVVVNDNRTSTISIAGPDAVEVVGDLTTDVAGDLPKYGAIEVSIEGLDVVVVRSDFLNSIAFDFIASEGDRKNLIQALGKRTTPVGPATLEAVRIERGIPGFESELNEDHNPLEASLIDSVDFNKGCYIGQEVVARLNTYNKVQRRLIVLQWIDGSVLPGNEVKGKDGNVGVVTSVAQHPHGGYVGLAYVKRSFMDDDVVIGPSGIVATISSAG
jgi:folate-binding protein YgfZ